MTMLQIQAMLDCAEIREHNGFAAQAALHGRKIRSKSYDSLFHHQPEKEEKPSEQEYDKMTADSLKILEGLKHGK